MFTVSDLHRAIGGRLEGLTAAESKTKAVGPIVTDSRQVETGDVFWARRGAHQDGADFAGGAFARGASGAVVSRPVATPAEGWSIVVDDPQQALWQWAAWVRSRFDGTLVGVTGSVGKTTTRQMIYTALRSQMPGKVSPRNYNNHVGVPISLSRLEPSDRFAVLELAASRKGEIAALAELSRPSIGVITCIGDSHLAGFGSREGIARAKTELLASLPADGLAVLGDDPWLRRMARSCAAPVMWVGCSAGCDLIAEDVRSDLGRLSFRLGESVFRVPVWGRHHLVASLAAVAVGRRMGLSDAEIADALTGFEVVPMRCQMLDVRGATIINDAYNANPTSMRAALELLRDFDATGRRIAVCGDMLELGDEAAVLHWQVGREAVATSHVDLLIACGDYARHVVAGARAAGMPTQRAIPCRKADDVLPYLGQAVQPGDVVLIKGSRAMAMERLVAALAQYPKRRSA